MGTVGARCPPPPDLFATPTSLCRGEQGPTIPAYHSSVREGPPTDRGVEKLCRFASTSFLIRLLQRSVDQTKESECQADDFRIAVFSPSLFFPHPSLFLYRNNTLQLSTSGSTSIFPLLPSAFFARCSSARDFCTISTRLFDVSKNMKFSIGIEINFELQNKLMVR